MILTHWSTKNTRTHTLFYLILISSKKNLNFKLSKNSSWKIFLIENHPNLKSFPQSNYFGKINNQLYRKIVKVINKFKTYFIIILLYSIYSLKFHPLIFHNTFLIKFSSTVQKFSSRKIMVCWKLEQEGIFLSFILKTLRH